MLKQSLSKSAPRVSIRNRLKSKLSSSKRTLLQKIKTKPLPPSRRISNNKITKVTQKYIERIQKANIHALKNIQVEIELLKEEFNKNELRKLAARQKNIIEQRKILKHKRQLNNYKYQFIQLTGGNIMKLNEFIKPTRKINRNQMKMLLGHVMRYDPKNNMNLKKNKDELIKSILLIINKPINQ